MPYRLEDRAALAPPLATLVDGLTALVDTHASEGVILQRGEALLRDLLARDDWLPAQMAEPDPQFYRQYLLYRDPAARFSVLSFVWGPGQHTPVHDHTVWGLVGILRGAELNQAYRLGAGGKLLADGPPVRMEAGQVAAVSPTLGDIHQVSNAFADRVSIGVHVYGGDIGAIDRSVFGPDGARRPFRSGYANVAAGAGN